MTIDLYRPRKTINIETQGLKFRNFGGQGRLYLWPYNGKKYVIKVIPGAGDLARKLKYIYEKITKEESQPVILKHRLLPVGQGVAKTSEFEFQTLDDKWVSLFIYNWVEGSLLFDYVAKKVSNISQIANKIIDGLLFFEKIGIVHGDLFPDNFIIDNDNEHVYLIDIDGAGVLSDDRKKWIWKPTVSGKRLPGFAKPPEFETNPDIYTQRWEGITLLYYILRRRSPFGGSPFFFLKRMDKEVLEDFIRNINKHLLAWPPYGIENMEKKYLNEHFLKNIKAIREHFLKKDEKITQLLFSTFVHGFLKPNNRPQFSQIKKRLGL